MNWELSVVGEPQEIYKNLNDAFTEKYIEERIDPKLGARTYTDPGLSEQFRTVAKSVQSVVPILKGTVKFTCGGDCENTLWMKVEPNA